MPSPETESPEKLWYQLEAIIQPYVEGGIYALYEVYLDMFGFENDAEGKESFLSELLGEEFVVFEVVSIGSDDVAVAGDGEVRVGDNTEAIEEIVAENLFNLAVMLDMKFDDSGEFTRFIPDLSITTFNTEKGVNGKTPRINLLKLPQTITAGEHVHSALHSGIHELVKNKWQEVANTQWDYLLLCDGEDDINWQVGVDGAEAEMVAGADNSGELKVDDETVGTYYLLVDKESEQKIIIRSALLVKINEDE